MKLSRKAFSYLWWSSVFAVLVAFMLLSIVFYGALRDQLKNEVRFAARSMRFVAQDQLSALAKVGGFRVTLIDAQGVVLLDTIASPATMENHATRPEMVSALSRGAGESQRESTTQRQQIYYYAITCADGNILRVSREIRSIMSIFTEMLPFGGLSFLSILLITVMVSRWLTGSIVAPFSAYTASGGRMYDEFAPFLSRIDAQNAQIKGQIADLDERAATLALIASNMREGLVLAAPSGDIISINDSAQVMFGQSAAHTIFELTRDPIILSGAQAAYGGVDTQCHCQIGSRLFDASFSPLRVGGMIMVLTDITQKIESEKIRRAFTASVSHELKTPLTTIYGYAELMKEGMVKDADVRGISQKICVEATRLTALIEDILRLSQMEEVKETTLEPCDVYAVTKRVAAELTAYAQAQRVTLQVVGSDCMANAHPRYLRDILFNLIDNAIKYNREGGSVTVSIDSQNEHAHITVTDTGIGMAEEHIPRIFERFYRIDPSRSKKTGGTGLGLSIVKHAVMYHDGRIVVTSAKDIGTQITVILPSTPLNRRGERSDGDQTE